MQPRAYTSVAGLTGGVPIHTSGARYAGVPTANVQTAPSLAAALELLQRRGQHSIYLLPTYTALKEVRRTLAGWEAVNQ